VIARARVYLSELEATRAPLPAPGPQGELALFAPPPTVPTSGAALTARLNSIQPEELSPRQALDLVFELHQLAKSEPPR